MFLEDKVNKYQKIQDYLKEACKKENFTELAVDINRFEATIDIMHDRILETIEQIMSER